MIVAWMITGVLTTAPASPYAATAERDDSLNRVNAIIDASRKARIENSTHAKKLLTDYGYKVVNKSFPFNASRMDQKEKKDLTETAYRTPNSSAKAIQLFTDGALFSSGDGGTKYFVLYPKKFTSNPFSIGDILLDTAMHESMSST